MPIHVRYYCAHIKIIFLFQKMINSMFYGLFKDTLDIN